MKKAILIAGLYAAVALSAPQAFAQGFQPAPTQDGGQAAAPAANPGEAPPAMGLAEMKQNLLDQARQQFMSLTPEQQQQILNAAKQKVESLTPEQRQQMIDAAKQKMDGITPEQQLQYIEEAKQKFESLSPEEQDQLKQRALRQAQKLAPPDAQEKQTGEDEPQAEDQQKEEHETGDGQEPQTDSAQ